MTDILDTVKVRLADRYYFGHDGTVDVRALVAEVESLRQRHAEAVEAAFREGHAAGANDYFEASHGAGIINACKCWLASEAKARLT